MFMRSGKALWPACVVFVGALIFTGLASFRVEVPFAQPLGGCGRRTQTLAFVCPPGHSLFLVLGVPEAAQMVQGLPHPTGSTYRALVTVRQAGYLLATIPVNSASAGQCNWLENEEPGAGLGKGHYFAGYFVGGRAAQMGQLLKADRRYSVSVTFQGSPPPHCSLWLFGLVKHPLSPFSRPPSPASGGAAGLSL